MKKLIVCFIMMIAIIISFISCDKQEHKNSNRSIDSNNFQIISGPGQWIKVFKVQLHRKNGQTAPRNDSKPCNCVYCFGMCYPEGTWEPTNQPSFGNIAISINATLNNATVYFLTQPPEEATYYSKFYVDEINSFNFGSRVYSVSVGEYTYNSTPGLLTLEDSTVVNYYGSTIVDLE